MNGRRQSVLMIWAMASVALVGFQSKTSAPVGSWILVKGSFLDQKRDVTLSRSTVTQTKTGPVVTTKMFKSRALMTKSISFSNEGEYTEKRSGIALDSKAPTGTEEYPFVKYDSPWDKVHFNVINDKTLSLVSADGTLRKIEFHVDGDKLTLVQGKDVEIYVKSVSP